MTSGSTAVGSPSLAAETRSKMTKRFDRAKRRFGQMGYKVEMRDKAVLVEDDFAAMLHEWKQIVYDFCGFVDEAGIARVLGKKCYELLNGWLSVTLSPDDRSAWDRAMAIRDVEVHDAPLAATEHVTESKWGKLFGRDNDDDVIIKDIRWLAKLDGGGEVDLIRTSASVMDSMEKFIRAFDTIR